MPVHHGAKVLFNFATQNVLTKVTAVESGPLLQKMQQEVGNQTLINPTQVTVTFANGTAETFAVATTATKWVYADVSSPAESWPFNDQADTRSPSWLRWLLNKLFGE